MTESKDGENKFKKQKVVQDILSIEDQRKSIVERLKRDSLEQWKLAILFQV
jgi:hypothetical protein